MANLSLSEVSAYKIHNKDSQKLLSKPERRQTPDVSMKHRTKLINQADNPFGGISPDQAFDFESKTRHTRRRDFCQTGSRLARAKTPNAYLLPPPSKICLPMSCALFE